MITLTINGKQQKFDGDPEMPLLWVLRDELNLKGTKFGCGMGLCGACTVHVNGEPVRSCVMSAADAAGNVKYPNVNSLVEMTDMREAQRSYEANINVIGATRRMIQKTIEILKA